VKNIHILSARKSQFPPLQTWVKTSRPFSLSAAVSPVLVGSAIAGYQGVFNISIFLATLFACLFLQIGTNYFNEYFDYHYGLDHAGSLGSTTVIFRNEMSAAQVLGGAITSFAIAVLLGILLIFLVGPAIILFGIAGMLIAYFYSAKPFKFASRGLGDILVYIAMGFLMTWGSYYVQIHQWSWIAFAASVPVGFLVTSILNMNNVRDYQDDRAVDKKTLPVRFGIRFGQLFHATLLIGSYVATTIFALVGLLPLLTLGVWLTFPLAYTNVRSVVGATERKAYIVGIKKTSLLHLVFGVVLALTIVIATFLPHYHI
jgi:1,4-dihydroxy-2-naphthoate octaprenyltransferase